VLAIGQSTKFGDLFTMITYVNKLIIYYINNILYYLLGDDHDDDVQYNTAIWTSDHKYTKVGTSAYYIF